MREHSLEVNESLFRQGDSLTRILNSPISVYIITDSVADSPAPRGCFHDRGKVCCYSISQVSRAGFGVSSRVTCSP